MQNNLTTINQNAKQALLKAKNLIDFTSELLVNRANKALMKSFENFSFSLALGHTAPVNSIAITPDGKHIVSGSRDGTIKLWDMYSSALHVNFVSFVDNKWLA